MSVALGVEQSSSQLADLHAGQGHVCMDDLHNLESHSVAFVSDRGALRAGKPDGNSTSSSAMHVPYRHTDTKVKSA